MMGEANGSGATKGLGEHASQGLQGATPSTLVDPFAHYADRVSQLVLRENARLVSNSEVQTFKRCRRKWWLAWFRGLRPKVEKSTGPRAVGDRVHRALSHWYVREDRVDPVVALNILIESDLRQLMRGEHYRALEVTEQATLLKDWKKDADLERAMLEGYMQWVTEEGADSDLEILESERYLDTRLPVPYEDPKNPVYIIAKIDTRVRRISDGVRLFVDHKTVAAFAAKTAFIKMDEQMLMYHLIEWLNEEENRCDGALYNMLRRVKRTVQAKPPFFQRMPVYHNSHEIAAFRQRLIGTINDILHAEETLRNPPHGSYKITPYRVAYPTPRDTCTWDCDFFMVCPLFDDGSRAEDMIDQYYTKGDPLSYYVTPVLPKEEG